MESYFSAISIHLEDRVDITVVSTGQTLSSKSLISLGIDNLIYTRNLTSNQQNRIYLPQNTSYRSIAKGITYNKCILGSQAGSVDQFDLQNQQTKPIYKSQYKINSLTNSPTNRFLAISSDQSKCVLIDLQSLRSSKCRPGHQQGVAIATFSANQKYLASIGMDKTLLIYNIENFDQPLQVYRYKICKNIEVNGMSLSGTFNKVLQIFYAPGMKQLQIFQQLNGKWDHRVSTFMKHQSIILMAKTLKQYLLLTCAENQLFIWNNRNQQKIVVIQQFALIKVVEVNDSFWGCRKDDGKIYHYEKVLNQSFGGVNSTNQQNGNQMMQIQNQQNKNENDVINFDDEEEEQDEKDNISQQEKQFEIQKKSKADKIITVYPQDSVVYSTSLFQGARYIYTNQAGYLIQRRQTQGQIRIQFQSEQLNKNQLLFINKEIHFADLNEYIVAYANQNSFGIKFLDKLSELESWEKSWWDITAITCTYNWIAVVNDQQVKIFDLVGNQLKTISFDRQIIAITAYQNLLAIAYHESIPIWGCQCLSMQLYVVNNQKSQAIKCSSCHVPIKPESHLKYFKFSMEGMLISQDTLGYIRVYSLETNSWASVLVREIEDTRRLWILGMKDYKLVYWNTSHKNPDPAVGQGLVVKNNFLGTSIAVDSAQALQVYPFLMFERFCLDHQKCRNRLWYHLKFSRNQKHPGYSEISKILTEKQLIQRHNQLDKKFCKVIKHYITSKMIQKALITSKTLIRTIQAGKNLIQIFDQLKFRKQAVELEYYFDQKQKQLEYEMMQSLDLQNLKQQAQKNIKPKGQNNPFNKKKNYFSSIPSLNNSQLSQGSNFDNLSQRSTIKGTKQNGMSIANKKAFIQTPQKEEGLNPFVKKNSTEDDMNIKSRLIDEQIEKYGIKKKAQINKKGKQI